LFIEIVNKAAAHSGWHSDRLPGQIIEQAAREKAEAITLQSAMRTRRAKQDSTMRQHQVIREEQLRQMGTVKKQAIKDDAAKKLQAAKKGLSHKTL
jgi:hypothetical protein